MLKKILSILLLLLAQLSLIAQVDTSHLRISLLTCGPGEEIWETFGHTGVRIIDSVHHTDMVYNYGTFDGFDKNFELKFMRGKLPYYLSLWPFPAFMEEYVEGHRSVQEQVIILNGEQKQAIYDSLQWNAEPRNKYYKYDFFFDNCATRIRDRFANAMGTGFKYNEIRPAGNLTYRNIINQYLYRRHWERFGINMLLGSRIDKVMSNADIMFLPDYLRDGVGSATYKGQKVAGPVQLILPGSPPPSAGLNQPLLVMWLICALTILGLTVPSLAQLGKVMTSLLLFVTGLLGLIMLLMWFGTNHQGCSDNYNILWALPTNLILAFAKKTKKGKYAVIAILLLLVSLLLHILKVQGLPLLELSPLLLALLFIYGTIYRQDKPTAKTNAIPQQ